MGTLGAGSCFEKTCRCEKTIKDRNWLGECVSVLMSLPRAYEDPQEPGALGGVQPFAQAHKLKKGALVIKAIPQMDLIKEDKSAISDLFINLDIALKFWLVLQKTGQNKTWYPLGPNMQYTLPTKTYDLSTQPAGNQFRRAYNWEGQQYVGINPTLLFGNIVSSIEHDPLQVVTHDGVKFLQLSLMVEWQLNNLDASFEKVVGTRKRTVMVYSDLVESTVVGSGKFPLLREVQL